MLFGRPIFSSVETFFFGHSKPLDRAIRSSAHNYYIDLAYNFGVVSLVPILGMLLYLSRLIWARRRDIWTDDGLLWITGAVIFLFLVDSNFKVMLRQPYPGIFAFFLCGVLLSRLRCHKRPEEATGRVGGPVGEGR
jgi:O-antigen ligase